MLAPRTSHLLRPRSCGLWISEAEIFEEISRGGSRSLVGWAGSQRFIFVFLRLRFIRGGRSGGVLGSGAGSFAPVEGVPSSDRTVMLIRSNGNPGPVEREPPATPRPPPGAPPRKAQGSVVSGREGGGPPRAGRRTSSVHSPVSVDLPEGVAQAQWATQTLSLRHCRPPRRLGVSLGGCSTPLPAKETLKPGCPGAVPMGPGLPAREKAAAGRARAGGGRGSRRGSARLPRALPAPPARALDLASPCPRRTPPPPLRVW